MTGVDAAAVALGAFLVIVGVTHFPAAAYYRRLVPRWMPAPGALVAASGAAEIAIGLAVLAPPTRAWGAWAAVGLLAGYVVVVHGDAARGACKSNERFLDRPLGVATRLGVNGIYVGWALVVALTAP